MASSDVAAKKTGVFHQGELEVQQKVGVAERMSGIGPRVIRDYMPEQHSEFYQQLNYIFLGAIDRQGQVWASLMAGPPGFIKAPNNQALTVNAKPLAGDPLLQILAESTPQQPARLGLLGIDLSNRRRNRLSTVVSAQHDEGFELQVLQSFGNCPRYIQTRNLKPVNWPNDNPPDALVISQFDEKIAAFIKTADTFFVASTNQTQTSKGGSMSDGADVSHRGGQPGFVSVEDAKTLIIPDYDGNNFFNTLGNFQVNPAAGLLFIDFSTGDVITLTGSAEIIWDAQARQYFKGADRLWRFTLKHGYLLPNALPYRWEFDSFSDNSLSTGTWNEARSIALQQQANQWLEYDVQQIIEENQQIKSFYLTPQNGILPRFSAGQFITLKVEIDGETLLRNYTVSSSPHDPFIRISVKREQQQAGSQHISVSNYLHNTLKVTSKLNLKEPLGKFTYDAQDPRPAVFLAAGVGITPMVSMLRYAVQEAERSGKKPRPIYMINLVRNEVEQAFSKEIMSFQHYAPQLIQVIWLHSQPLASSVEGKDYDFRGRLSADTLRQILPLDNYEFFICGPTGFMQHSYDLLRSLGVQDESIGAESFGPAALVRDRPEKAAQHEAAKPVAEQALVVFKQSGFEQMWTAQEGSLLEFAEAHGVQPPFSCRSGQCGSCKVKVAAGTVVHLVDVGVELAEDEALLCCSMPAAAQNASLELDL